MRGIRFTPRRRQRQRRRQQSLHEELQSCQLTRWLGAGVSKVQLCRLDRPRPLQKLKAHHKQLGKTLRYIIYLCAALHEGSFNMYNKSAPSGVCNQGPVVE